MRRLDATDYWYLYDQAIRLQAIERRFLITAVNAGFAGGEHAEALFEDLGRVGEGLPRLRMKQRALDILGNFLTH